MLASTKNNYRKLGVTGAFEVGTNKQVLVGIISLVISTHGDGGDFATIYEGVPYTPGRFSYCNPRGDLPSHPQGGFANTQGGFLSNLGGGFLNDPPRGIPNNSPKSFPNYPREVYHPRGVSFTIQGGDMPRQI